MTAAVASMSRFYALCEAARSALDRQRKLSALANLETVMELRLRAMWLREAKLLLEAYGPEDYVLAGGKLKEAAGATLEEALLHAQQENAALAASAWAGTKDAYMLGAKAASDDLGIGLSLAQTNPLAEKWALYNAALRVTAVNQTTRAYINTVVRDGIAKGTSYQTVARSIVARYAEFGVPSPLHHIRSRAELVAVTEMGQAYVEASMSKARMTSLPTEKHWLTVGDRRVDDALCRPNEAAGWIPSSKAFPSGHDAPLAHPGCRCDVQLRLVPMSAEERAKAAAKTDAKKAADDEAERLRKAGRAAKARERRAARKAAKAAKPESSFEPRYDAVRNLDGKDYLSRGPGGYPPASDSFVARMRGNKAWEDYLRKQPGFGGDFDQSTRGLYSRLTRNWAGTSGDSDTGALAMQLAAHEEFGMGAAARKAVTDGLNAGLRQSVELAFKEDGPGLRAFLRGMYDETQESLRADGITEVSVWRGMGVNSQYRPQWMEDAFGPAVRGTREAPVEVGLRPLSSFSTERATGEAFVQSYAGEGLLMRGTVPADRIISTYRTGFGTAWEEEFVVLDSPGKLIGAVTAK